MGNKGSHSEYTEEAKSLLPESSLGKEKNEVITSKTNLLRATSDYQSDIIRLPHWKDSVMEEEMVHVPSWFYYSQRGSTPISV